MLNPVHIYVENNDKNTIFETDIQSWKNIKIQSTQMRKLVAYLHDKG